MSVRLDDRNRHLLALMQSDDRELQSLVVDAIADRFLRQRIQRIMERRDRRAIVATMVHIPASGDEDLASVIEDPSTYSDGRPVTTKVLDAECRRVVVNPPPLATDLHS